MNKLPQELTWPDADNKWAAILNPIINKELVNGILLKDIDVTAGDNVINHRLGRKLQGYIVTRINAASAIYDKQDTNQLQGLTLVLNSSNPCKISLWVF